ncbi:Arc family DNA-binding protein [Paracidovorax citrulli]|uniref:Arc domain protein DNA binding domain protein n=2 Tax=Paracidovorax citrulli TaxID=80869 RepID=A1TMW6_PARC0|nr:Arc family DNA-binding protein [Paracidovorax citrulli]ABM32304.1 Arc domain protein DNA binding domain protein [Paracidovorax citrulli AAC00-1]ATG94683.1 Arc family DNA-binding protein [Paracidovorax citrulli]MVT30106.1 Arc family DNA-binding protein [Paracidovorax citrulli]MVT30156.1 Arc family DNA-binding protein [Paracidovorax citrulli]PVY66506.1 Arc-like DNA binding dprotein [Paracidovorax citrulli]
MKQTDPQYKLRIPPDLKEQIETAAKESGRSMNAEIVARLEDSFAARNDGTVLAAMDVVRREWELSATVNRLEFTLRGYQDQLSFLRQRMARERRLLKNLQEVRDQARQRGDLAQVEHIQAEIDENEEWMKASEVELKQLEDVITAMKRQLVDVMHAAVKAGDEQLKAVTPVDPAPPRK